MFLKEIIFNNHFFLLIILNICLNSVLISLHVISDVIFSFIILLFKDIALSCLVYYLSGKRKVHALTYLVILLVITVRLFLFSGLPRYMSYQLDGKTIVFNGKIKDISVTPEDSFYIKNDLFGSNTGQPKKKPYKKTCIITSELGKIIAVGLTDDARYGDHYMIKGEISAFSAPRNPGGFDERSYYAASGIYLKVFVDESSLQENSYVNPLFLAILSFKTKMICSLYEFLPEEHAGIAAAVILGDTSGLSREMRDSMNSAGVSHIVAVSGTAVFFVISPIKRILKRSGLSDKGVKIAIIIVLVSFGCLIGWTPSISRAISVVLCGILLRILRRKTGYLNSLSFSTAVLMMISPLFTLQKGFWLSVVTASGIVYLHPVLMEKISGIIHSSGTFISVLSLNLSAVISVLPLQIIISRCIPLMSPLSNMLIIPVAGILIPYGMVYSIISRIRCITPVFQILSLPLKGMIDWMIIVSRLFGESFSACISTGKYIILSFCGAVILIILFFANSRTRKLSALLIAFSLFMASGLGNRIDRYMTSGLEVVFADVGQGDSTILMIDGNFAVIIDAGKPENGYKTIRDILHYYGVKPVIYYATHCHSDHCGGLIGLMDEYGGRKLIVPEGTSESVSNDINEKETMNDENIRKNFGEEVLSYELLSAAQRNGIDILEVSSGAKHRIYDDFEIEILSPGKETVNNNDDLNSTSMVLMIKYKGLRIIICGDAVGESENRMISEGKDLNADIYRISHHGSPSSTGNDMIDAVNAGISIISVGYNIYGHPSDKVLRRLKDHGSEIYRTDINGAVILRYNGKKAFLKTMLP